MRLLTLGLLAGFFVCGSATAATATSQPPSEASIQELLKATHARATFEALMNKMGGAVLQPSLQPLAGPAIDARKQKIIDEQTKKLSDLRESQLTWTSIEPIYVDYYRSALSQADVDNMLAVFKTSSAQEAVEKLQVATLSSILMMQRRMATVIIQEQQISRATSDLLKAH